jgi:hypothetical protein
MAAKRRHWHEKDGRFWARIAIPKDLQGFFGKTQLTEPLGGDLRAADRAHAGAVARLQDQIRDAQALRGRSHAPSRLKVNHGLSLPELADQAVWDHYTQILGEYETNRRALPNPSDVEAEQERLFQRIKVGEVEQNPIAIINASTELELMLHARAHNANIRARRLAALKASLQIGDMRLVHAIVQTYVGRHELALESGSREWLDIAQKFARAEIEALNRTIEMDHGDFGGKPSDPLVKPPEPHPIPERPVPLRSLFEDYIASRQRVGRHLDGGKRWSSVIDHLLKFVKDSDARK